MTAKLEFSLPDEQHEHRVAVKSLDLLGAIEDYDQWLRNIVKYGGDDEHADPVRCRARLHECLEDNQVEDLML